MRDLGTRLHSARVIDQGELFQSNHAVDKTFTSFVSKIITKLAWGAGWFWVTLALKAIECRMTLGTAEEKEKTNSGERENKQRFPFPELSCGIA